MKELSTTINGFLVEIEVGDDESGGWVSKGKYSGSIASLEYNGVLEDCDGFELEVGRSTIEKIVKWAASNGY